MYMSEPNIILKQKKNSILTVWQKLAKTQHNLTVIKVMCLQIYFINNIFNH